MASAGATADDEVDPRHHPGGDRHLRVPGADQGNPRRAHAGRRRGAGAIYYFSRLGELTTLNWLISTLLPYTVFALIVVFAAEIRQGLARLGPAHDFEPELGRRRLTLTTTSCWPPIFFLRTRPAH